MADGEPQKKKLSKLSYALYYSVLFFPYWFGSDHFDIDGDGDFDPEDVQKYFKKKGILHKDPSEEDDDSGKAADKVERKKVAGAHGGDSTSGGASAARTDKKDGQSTAGVGVASMFDRDGDGDVDMWDIVNTKVDGEAEEDIAMQDLKSGKIIPFFILGECVVVLFLWIILAVVKSGEDGTAFLATKGGLDSIWDHKTDLRFYGPGCEDYRARVLRWFSYQLTHVGVMHVMSNVLINLMLGIPLEGIHGQFRLAVMFNVGVFGGACCAMVTDVHTAVVGCSGGCYSLLGIHTADLIMNWTEKRFRLPTLAMLVFLVLVDVISNVLSGSEHTSHAAHVGGAIAGLLVGVTTGKNLRAAWYERYLIGAAWVVGTCLTVFCLAWLFGHQDGPVSIWESMAGEDGWCWWSQMLDTSIKPLQYRCIRCGTPECIESWQAFGVSEAQKIQELWVQGGRSADSAPAALLPAGFDKCSEMGWFGARRGACVKQLSSALPESKRGRLSVGDRLVAINGVDVFALPRSEIKAIWRTESLKCDELVLRFASPS